MTILNSTLENPASQPPYTLSSTDSSDPAADASPDTIEEASSSLSGSASNGCSHHHGRLLVPRCLSPLLQRSRIGRSMMSVPMVFLLFSMYCTPSKYTTQTQPLQITPSYPDTSIPQSARSSLVDYSLPYGRQLDKRSLPNTLEPNPSIPKSHSHTTTLPAQLPQSKNIPQTLGFMFSLRRRRDIISTPYGPWSDYLESPAYPYHPSS